MRKRLETRVFQAPWLITTLKSNCASILLVGAANYLCARELGAGRKESFLGGLWWIATITHCFPVYAGMDEPDLFGAAAMTWAFWLFLRAGHERAACIAIALMAVAGFIKHNLLAIPLTAFAYLFLFRRSWTLAALVASACVAWILVTTTILIYGWNFVDEMLVARTMSSAKALAELDHLKWIVVVWPFWAAWLLSGPWTRAKATSSLLVGFGLVTWFFWKMGSGVDENVQFELVFATSLCLALTLDWLRRSPSPSVRFGVSSAFCVLLLARLLSAPEADPFLLLVSPEYRASVNEQAAILNRELQRIRAIPDPVACSFQSICFLAGKAFVYNNFAVDQRIATGRSTEKEMREATRGIRFETVDERVKWRPHNWGVPSP